jgi:hypothetical protein
MTSALVQPDLFSAEESIQHVDVGPAPSCPGCEGAMVLVREGATALDYEATKPGVVEHWECVAGTCCALLLTRAQESRWLRLWPFLEGR